MNVTGIKEKLGQLLTSVRSSKMLSLLGMFLIMAAIPLTVYVSQQQQEIRQRAAESNCGITQREPSGSTCLGQSCNQDSECKTGYCCTGNSCGAHVCTNADGNTTGGGKGSSAGASCRHDSDCGNPGEWVCPGEDFSREKNVPKDTCIRKNDPRLAAKTIVTNGDNSNPTCGITQRSPSGSICLGQSCSDDYQCKTGYCCTGKDPGDCPRGHVCTNADGSVAAPAAPTAAPTNIPQTTSTPTASPTPSIILSSSQTNKVIGDMNGDNKLTIEDYPLFVACYGNKANLSSCTNKKAADVDGNEAVDLIDFNVFFKNLSEELVKQLNQ